MHLSKPMVGSRVTVLYAKVNLRIWAISTSGILLCKARVTLWTGTPVLQVFGGNKGVFMMILSKQTLTVNRQYAYDSQSVYIQKQLFAWISGALTRKASGTLFRERQGLNLGTGVHCK